MLDEDLRNELITEMQIAADMACRDYFIWSKGRTLYEAGVEALVQTYLGQRLFAQFAGQYDTTIHLEKRLAEFGLTGRSDVYLQLAKEHIFVEVKRYLNDTIISKDIARLRELVKREDTTGFLLAPCFVEKALPDWADKYCRRVEQDKTLKVHLGRSQSLPIRFRQDSHWQNYRAFVIEVFPHNAVADPQLSTSHAVE